jgi:hypothetical protein
VLANIERKRNEKKNQAEVESQAQELENTSAEDSQLKERIKNLATHSGTKSYEDKKNIVSEALDRLFGQDQESAKAIVKEIIEAKMTDCGVSEDELEEAEKVLFSKLKNGEINDKDQLEEAQETLVDAVGNKEVDKKISSLKIEVKMAVFGSKKEKNDVKSKLLALLKEDNIYIKNREAEIKNLLDELAKSSRSTTNSNSPSAIP